MRGNKALTLELEKVEELESSEENTAPFQKLSPEKMEALILDHREHGKRLAWSFLTTWRVRMKHDEVISVVGAALCEAANRFDETRGVAFKTFFFYHLRGMLLKEIARMIHEQRILQFYPSSMMGDYQMGDQTSFAMSPIVPVEQNNPERLIEKKEIARMTWDACSQLDELEQEVIVRHFVYDQPLIDIAEELEYCRCHISRVKSRGLAKLQRQLKKTMLRPDGENLSPEAKAAAESGKRLYTGGRGRRRQQKADAKSTLLKRVA